MSYASVQSETSINPDTQRVYKNHFASRSLSRSATTRRHRAGNLRRKSRPQLRPDFPIIVHCHLRWDWVWQRPQQFISRLSQRHRVLFVELIGPDPQLAAPLVRYHSLPDYPNLTVMCLQFPSWRWEDGDYVDTTRRRLVQEFLKHGPLAGQFKAPVQWFYDPMAVTAFAGQMGEVLTVYDCMDELSKFRFAPVSIQQREAELLARADVVFAGGRKLHESKSSFNTNCHFHGCGVDVEHFGRARESQTIVPDAVARLKKPVLGYFGVIDERLDYDLLSRLAQANPDWSIAMVGPVMKVDPQALPQHPNLHLLGQRPYADLPALCKGFDLCLMPFALNESTEYINPTKALEYMATGRMIVSTAVADVVRNFGSVVKVASNADEFIGFCQRALERPDHQAISRGLKMAGENSWDSIVAQLEQHIFDAAAAVSREKVEV